MNMQSGYNAFMSYTLDDVQKQLGSFVPDVIKIVEGHYHSIARQLMLMLNQNWQNDSSFNIYLKCTCLRLIIFIKTHPDLGEMESNNVAGFIAWYADAFYDSLPLSVSNGVKSYSLYKAITSIKKDDFIKHFYQQIVFLYKMTMNYNTGKYYLPISSAGFFWGKNPADPNHPQGFFKALCSTFAQDIFYDIYVQGFSFQVNAYSSTSQCYVPKNGIDFIKGANETADEIYKLIANKI